MSIERKHTGHASNRIDMAGEYRVTVQKTEVKPTKNGGKRMLVVTFVTDDEKEINGYYVQTLKWHIEALSDLKIACGLSAKSSTDLLMGKRLGIAVGEQTPQEDGRIFMQVEGYGKESDVDGFVEKLPFEKNDDEVPF